MRFSRYQPSILPMAGSLAIAGERRYHGDMPMDFAERLARAQQSSGSLVCVGLDPDLAKLPKDLAGAREPAGHQDLFAGAAPVYAFNRRIIDATAASIRYIRERAPHALVILDGKRNDIGNTAEAYVREAFDRYGADAATVNPYMGEDSVRPFLARPERGAILLCRTSNPGARDFQDLLIDGVPLYRRVAERAAAQWNERGNLMLVVGATCPREMAELRRAHPELSFLVPGIGAQGGDLEATLAAGLNARGAGLLISSSRNIIYAGGGAAGSIRAAAAELYTAINKHRPRTLEGALDGAAVDPQCRAVGRGG
jgi:orotidine-5'-phosphate decarboxylase